MPSKPQALPVCVAATYTCTVSNSITITNTCAFEYLNTFRCIWAAKMKWQARCRHRKHENEKAHRNCFRQYCKKHQVANTENIVALLPHTFGVAAKLPRTNALGVRSFASFGCAVDVTTLTLLPGRVKVRLCACVGGGNRCELFVQVMKYA